MPRVGPGRTRRSAAAGSARARPHVGQRGPRSPTSPRWRLHVINLHAGAFDQVAALTIWGSMLLLEGQGSTQRWQLRPPPVTDLRRLCLAGRRSCSKRRASNARWLEGSLCAASPFSLVSPNTPCCGGFGSPPHRPAARGHPLPN